MSLQEKVQHLINTYGQCDQRTDAWHLKRGEMLTASEIYKGLATATPSQKHELMMSKLTPRPKQEGSGPRALLWGTRFEPIAKEIYCSLSPTPLQIADTTCIPHPTVPFLGASPDGILLPEDTENERFGTLVEFKCPISRDFSEETPVPDSYYHQMQLQMECTGLMSCEYIEMKFKQVTYSEWMDSSSTYKGFFAIHDDEHVSYKPLKDTRTPSQWIETTLNEEEPWEIVYWILEKHRTKQVLKEDSWLETHLPSLTAVWNEILDHRKNGSLPEHPREKTTLTL
jgi:putative phage-type endonuclease